MKSAVGFTVRIPLSLHKKVKETLKRENKSLNAIVKELIKEWLKKEQEKELFEAFSIAGKENVEYAAEAQKEVVLANEHAKER